MKHFVSIHTLCVSINGSSIATAAPMSADGRCDDNKSKDI